MRVGDLMATLVLLTANQRVLKTGGFIRGQAAGDSLPMFAHEVLHMQVLKSWVATIDQQLFQKINIAAGDAATCYQIEKQAGGGICGIQPAAASELLQEIRGLSKWLRVDTSLTSFFLPDKIEDEDALGSCACTWDW